MIHNNVKLIELVKRHDYKKDLYNDLEQETKHSSLPSFYIFRSIQWTLTRQQRIKQNTICLDMPEYLILIQQQKNIHAVSAIQRK